MTTTGSWRAKLRALPPLAFLAVGLLGLVTYAFPGYMTNDSFVQLMEARSGIYSDVHPPIMAFEWSILDAIISGPLLMLLLQGTLALAGLYRIFRAALTARTAAVMATLVMLFPPVLTTFGVIWKDSQMAAFLLVGIGACLDRRRWVRVAGLLALTLACAFRHNAPAAAVPAAIALFEWRPGLVWWKRYAVSTLAAIVMVVCGFAITRVLTVRHVPLSPAPIDVVDIIALSPDMPDAELRDVLRGTPLVPTTGIQAKARAIYTVRNPFWYDRGPDRMFDVAQTDEQREALDRAWLHLIRTQWRTYLESRFAIFEELIGYTDNGLWSPVWAGHYENDAQPLVMMHGAQSSTVQSVLASACATLAYETILFEPHLYLWLGVVLLILFCRDRLSIAVVASGLLYELAYFPVVATPDYRYSHWLVLSACCTAVLAFARRRKTR